MLKQTHTAISYLVTVNSPNKPMMLCKQQREGGVWRVGPGGWGLEGGAVVLNAAGGAPGLERKC